MLEQPWGDNVQGQRSPSKMVEGANLHLESNQIPIRDVQKAQTNCVCTRTERPQRDPWALPVWVGPANPDGERTYQYWPFSTSDLYNWKAQNPSFSEKPQGLIDLLDTILFTHNPTWDDCQQLLQVLFTMEEWELTNSVGSMETCSWSGWETDHAAPPSGGRVSFYAAELGLWACGR